MRLLTALAVTAVTLFTTVAPVSAASKQNRLSTSEVAQGWISLFDGETTFGWAPRDQARWVAANGTLTPAVGSGVGVLSTTTEFANFQLKADVWIDDVANSGIFLRCPTAGSITGTNAYEVNVFDRHPAWPSGSIHSVARASGRPQTVGRWNTYDIIADGRNLVVSINGQTVLNTRDDSHARGTLGLQYNGLGEVAFRNVKLRPLSLKPIFNGKDLSGWKAIPDRKSVYSVTPEGYLNVKDGNGDLQSVGEYGDFVLQMEIISNGQHLNSGVFFRAIPGQFWSGYESQIRNQWQGDDRTKPVDFGTGAIYNRQKARRVIPSDKEWFAKTIVAHGPHLAVWVNGIQVSDFTDTRPAHESARQGYRSKPGVLSLQGHDPTTDLSFRKIRIVELPAAK
ncbi:MAG: 3-keto-disaccharide hydrolase [Actinomycetota bacterium]